jgi:probable rRNA maturation factor
MSAKNKLSLSVQYPDPRLKDSLPRATLRRWVQAALFAPASITLRFVDHIEGQTLNRDYRGKDYATNVLTFDYNDGGEGDGGGGGGGGEGGPDDHPTQADIVLCTDVLLKEAQEQGKTLQAHCAHLVVHGVLHAQGYDHEDDAEAEEMESIETEILAKLGIDNPYQT